MEILVITRYENIPEADVKRWANSVFDSTWAANEFPEEQLREMKKDFLRGEEIGARTADPNGSGMSVITKWKLTR